MDDIELELGGGFDYDGCDIGLELLDAEVLGDQECFVVRDAFSDGVVEHFYVYFDRAEVVDLCVFVFVLEDGDLWTSSERSY